MVIEPYKYYVRKGESIIDFGDDIIHFDKDGKTIFKTLEFNGDLSSIREVPSSSFPIHFRNMLMYGKPDVDLASQLNQLKEESPIIIGGCGRSGTTLLTAILAAHPKLAAIDIETYAFYPRPLRLRNILNNKSEGRWIEKTPRNVCVFSTIKTIIPEAKLIHIVRDGRAVVTSHHPNHKQKYWVNKERWVNDVWAGLMFPAFLVKYEDLVLDTENTLKKICSFIGEDFSKDMLDFVRNSNIKDDASFGGKVSPLYSNSIYKWASEEHKKTIDDFNNDLRCQALMKLLNYV